MFKRHFFSTLIVHSLAAEPIRISRNGTTVEQTAQSTWLSKKTGINPKGFVMAQNAWHLNKPKWLLATICAAKMGHRTFYLFLKCLWKLFVLQRVSGDKTDLCRNCLDHVGITSLRGSTKSLFSCIFGISLTRQLLWSIQRGDTNTLAYLWNDSKESLPLSRPANSSFATNE